MTLDHVVSCVQVFEARWQRYHAEFILTFTDDTPDQSCMLVNGEFVNYHCIIDSLLQLRPPPSDIHDLILEFIKKFADDAVLLKQVDEVHKNYIPEKTLWWYTKDTFLYRLLNRALRVQNIELLYLFRFFIRDIRKQLSEHQCSKIIRVYRAQLIAKEELHTLTNLLGHNICFKSFLSATLSREKAIFYFGAINQTERSCDNYGHVLFEIEADPKNNTNGRRPFAEISQFSAFGDAEEDILFMLGTIFQVMDVCEENSIWTIKMTLWNYEDHDWNNASDIIQLDLGNQAVMDPTNLVKFCSTLLNAGEDRLAERLIENHLHELILSNAENQNAAQIGQCYQKLGHCALLRKECRLATKWLNKALDIFTCVLPENHLIIAATHLAMGNALSAVEDKERIHASYRKALLIYKQHYSEESLVIQACYANIKAFDSGDQVKELFDELVSGKGRLQDSGESIEINNEDDFRLCSTFSAERKQTFGKNVNLSTTEFESTIFSEQKQAISKQIPPCLFNQSIIGLILSRFTYPIIIYTCPCCKRRVWIYKKFAMVKGYICFLCIRRALSFGPGTVRQ